MISLRRGSVRDLLWNFARAEFEISDLGVRHTQPEMDPDLKDRLLRDERDTFTPEDWEALLQALLTTRADTIQPLLDLDLEWFRGELPANAWPNLRVLNLRIFAPLAPTRLLPEFVAALDAGATWEGVDPSWYPHLRAAFDPSKMHGVPMVVAESVSGPYTLFEGTTRMCVIYSRQQRGELAVPCVPMVLGVSEQISRWEFF